MTIPLFDAIRFPNSTFAGVKVGNLDGAYIKSASVSSDTLTLTYQDASNAEQTLSFTPSGSGGSGTFLGLSDTPSSYTANRWLKVNSGGTALEQVEAPTDTDTLLGLTDTPSSFGTAGQVLAVNSGATAAEWVDASSGSGLPADPNADSLLFWDDSDGAAEWVAAAPYTKLPTDATEDSLAYWDADNDNGDGTTGAWETRVVAGASGFSRGNHTHTAIALTDTPSSFGSAGQVLAVNSAGDALEWATRAEAPAATNTRYLAVKATSGVPSASELTAGISSTDGEFTIPSFTADSVNVIIAQPTTDTDLSSIEIAGIEQIGGFSKASTTVDVSGTAYEYWVTDVMQEDHITGAVVEVN